MMPDIKRIEIKMTAEMVEYLDKLPGTSRGQIIKEALYTTYPDMPKMQERGKYQRKSQSTSDK